MRHAAATFAFADRIRLTPSLERDVAFATSMPNIAEFRGLADPAVRDVPAVVYFHENQLTYPVRREDERDVHFAVSHVMTFRAADAVSRFGSVHAVLVEGVFVAVSESSRSVHPPDSFHNGRLVEPFLGGQQYVPGFFATTVENHLPAVGNRVSFLARFVAVDENGSTYEPGEGLRVGVSVIPSPYKIERRPIFQKVAHIDFPFKNRRIETV